MIPLMPLTRKFEFNIFFRVYSRVNMYFNACLMTMTNGARFSCHQDETLPFTQISFPLFRSHFYTIGAFLFLGAKVFTSV